jgi:hypothetical protein
MDFQWKSPFDTCPVTMSPLSLTNLQVSIGGQNVLNSTLSMTYENNVERGNIADKLQPRNINVSFNNNSNVPIDVIIFTFYSDQLTIDVETGIVTKLFCFLNIVIRIIIFKYGWADGWSVC